MNYLLLPLLMLVASAPAAFAADSAPPVIKGGRGVSLDDIFAQLDKNHDGKISKDEASGPSAQRFGQWDANGDGMATRQEIHDYRQRFGLDDQGGRKTATTAPTSTIKTASIIQEPADWRLETIAVPPGFAPDVKFKGSEEIRFAPGMFDNKSDTYFTCVIAIVAKDITEPSAADLQDFLEKYYRGLSTSRAQRSQLKIDPAQMQAVVTPVAQAKHRFIATIDFFDSFSDGRKIKLNIEIATFPNATAKQSTLLLLVSPSAKDSAVWPTLRGIGTKAEACINKP